MLVLGLDIIKGNPLSRTSPPMYAVVIIDESRRIVNEVVEASLNTIIRLVWEYSVNRLGIDNIYELAPTSRDVARILSLLPSHTEVYQVTLDNNAFVDIATQASKIGITLTSKPKPLQTAYICALLALNGIGTLIKGLERKTKIIITRGRSAGPGGSSANRYVRGMRTAVLRVVKEIKSALEKEKIDYDIVLRKSSGGLDSAIFTAYADSTTVRKIAKPYKGRDVRIIIKPVYTDIVMLQNESEKKKRPLIIGVDPGTETGLAIIDLSLNVLLVESSKNLDRLEVIDKVYQYGIPVLIAVDKNPPPESAKKLASMLGLPLYVPNESLDTGTKDKLIEWLRKKKYIDIEIGTTHERDALAAAIRAYRAFEKKFTELEKRLLEMDLDVNIDELKTMILRGHSISEVIEFAIDRYLSDIIEETVPSSISQSPARVTTNHDDMVKTLETRISELVRENEVLKNRIRELEAKIESMLFEKRFSHTSQKEIEVIRDRAISKLNEQVRQLQNVINDLRSEIEKLTNERARYLEIISMLMSRRVIVAPRLKSLALSNIHNIKNHITMNRIIVVENNYIPYEVLNIIKQLKAVLVFEKCSPNVEHLLVDEGLLIVCGLKIEKLSEDLAIIDMNELDSAMVNAIDKLYLSSKLKKRSLVTLEDVIRIISEYRNDIRQNPQI